MDEHVEKASNSKEEKWPDIDDEIASFIFGLIKDLIEAFCFSEIEHLIENEFGLEQVKVGEG